MRKASVLEQFEIYFGSGVLAAHANAGGEGFRQRDVKFYIGLFSNWMETELGGAELEIHNAQISRYLDALAREGLLRRTHSGGSPLYRLNRPGIVEVLSRMSNRERSLSPEQFFFFHYVIENYGRLIVGLAEREGSQFPRALRLELEGLCDPAALLARQLRHLDGEIAKLELRAKEGFEAAELARKAFDRGARLTEVVVEVQKRYPYELNNRKPLSELFREIPESMRRWELEEGAIRRARTLWKPMREQLVGFRAIVRQLALHGENG